MKTGIYEMTEKEFKDEDALTIDDIKLLMKSPMHYFSNVNKKTDKETIFLEAIKRAILDPEGFDNVYLKGERKSEFPLKRNDYTAIEIIRRNVNTTIFEKLLDRKNKLTLINRCYFWKDEINLILCKAMIPCVVIGNWIIDFILTDNAKAENFKQEVKEKNLAVDAAFLYDGVKLSSGAVPNTYILFAIEREFPHAVNHFYFSHTTLDRARITYTNAITQFAASLATNTWPGYSEKLIEL